MHVTAKDFFFSIKKNPQKTKNTNEQYIMYTIYGHALFDTYEHLVSFVNF